ncbi:MAG: hypothetical protein IPM54_31270 [Polyangiaceae bacterium]|nr:hypothetical protein [Polyangiaceae bacterium]
MNVEQRILALEALLEKVRTNAAKPRTGRGAAIGAAQPTAAAVGRATDDVAGPAIAAPIAAPPVRVPAPTTAAAKKAVATDDWGDTTETFDTPVPLAAPLPGPAKEAPKAPAAAATPKPAATKTPIPFATPKPAEAPLAKPGSTSSMPAVKPALTTPAVKPVVTPPAIKPVVTPAAKPATPANTPIPLTNKVAAPVIKPPAVSVAVKPAEPLISKTLTGVGDGAVKAPEIKAGAIAAGISLPAASEPAQADAPAIELEKKPIAAKSEPDQKPSLPSAIADSDGEEDAEPTQLYEPSAASRRAAELAQLAENQLDEAKKALGIDTKSDSDKVEIRLPEAKPAAEKIEVKVDAPKLDLPWVEKKSEPEKVEQAATADKDDKLPKKAGPSRTELDLELVASQVDVEKVELDVPEPTKAEAKAEAKPETKPAPVAVSEDKPIEKPEPAPISEKKPVVEKQAAPEKKPVFVEPEPIKPTTTSKGVPKLLIVAAVILLLAVGAFVAMQQGWIGGTASTPTVAPPTTTPPTATQTAAPTAPATAQPPTTDTAAPAASASAAPADSAAAPADSTAPADSALAAPADSAAPAASASAAPAAPATPGTPSVDPATLNNNQGLVFITSNKPARVYLTGKMVGQTNTELTVDCGMKFVRLADPNQDLTKPPIWLTPGAPKQIDCRKYTTFEIAVP